MNRAPFLLLLISLPAGAAFPDISRLSPGDLLAQAEKNAKDQPADPAAATPSAAAPVFSCYAGPLCQGQSIGQLPTAALCLRAGGRSWIANDMLCHTLRRITDRKPSPKIL